MSAGIVTLHRVLRAPPKRIKHSDGFDGPNLPGMMLTTIALQRAARHARELAERAGTPCWIMRDGRIVDAITGREAVLPEASAGRESAE